MSGLILDLVSSYYVGLLGSVAFLAMGPLASIASSEFLNAALSCLTSGSPYFLTAYGFDLAYYSLVFLASSSCAAYWAANLAAKPPTGFLSGITASDLETVSLFIHDVSIFLGAGLSSFFYSSFYASLLIQDA